jgi:hypothetical protein
MVLKLQLLLMMLFLLVVDGLKEAVDAIGQAGGASKSDLIHRD